MKLHHHFLPHPQTHQKAHLLHWHFFVIYILLFILLQVGFSLVNTFKPGVLGVNSNITVEQIISGTNGERAKLGLGQLSESPILDSAAAAKARNMFEENYWAHYSPSGKNPWGFMSGAGYKFVYAGENLARNFYNSDDVIKAWMNSPSHRDNMANSHYREIGVAVVDGTLQGQKTTLIVQMFATPVESLAQTQPQVTTQATSTQAVPIPPTPIPIQLGPTPTSRPLVVAGSSTTPPTPQALVDPYRITKSLGVGIISFIALLLILDFIILRRRGVFRISSNYLIQLSFLLLMIIAILAIKVGNII